MQKLVVLISECKGDGIVEERENTRIGIYEHLSKSCLIIIPTVAFL
jgi:hypothetical protein